MSKLAKILVTIVVIVVWMLLNTAIIKGTGTKSGGIFGIALCFAMIAAVRAIWKKSDNNGDDNKKSDDSSILQK